MVAICMVKATGEIVEPLPSVVDRQSRQIMYAMPPSPVPVLNYYNPYGVYGAQFLTPALDQDVADNSESFLRADVQVTGRQRTEDVIISPVAARNRPNIKHFLNGLFSLSFLNLPPLLYRMPSR